MKVQKPLVSVLFPVYNGELYLEEAIHSILDQNYDNFEIIIINDGSIDDSSAVIQKFSDSRIRFYENRTNKGLAATLNRAISLSKGDYLARQDADDVSLPQRFEKQVAFLETHTGYGMVGTWARVRRGIKENEYILKLPTDSLTLKFELFFTCPFVHSSVMFRKEVFDKVGLYLTNISPNEDYELWPRIAREFDITNIPEPLHIYRDLPFSMSKHAGNMINFYQQIEIQAENFALLLGKNKPGKIEYDLVCFICGDYSMLSKRPNYWKIKRLFEKIVSRFNHLYQIKPDYLKSVIIKYKGRMDNNIRDYLINKYGNINGKIFSLLCGVWQVDMKRLFHKMFKEYIQ